jgi:putative oxidoreductase
MPNSSSGITVLAGRILMSVIFLLSGTSKVLGYSGMVAYATAKGLPMAGAGIAIAAVIEILGGLAVLTGFQTRIVSWILFLYLIPVSFTIHNFWALQGMERMDNQIHFMKNFAIMGGLLILSAHGAGPLSIDGARAAKS